VGQPVAVTPMPSSRPGLLRFEANRSLTGMGHEFFTTLDQAQGPRPAAMLARRLLQTGQVESVHIYSNIVTVDLHKGYTGDSLAPIIEDLYIYYREGFVPPPLELPPEEATASDPTAAGGGGGQADAAASRVPAHLLERSRQAKERWLAKEAG
jgi:hypothetical protein